MLRPSLTWMWGLVIVAGAAIFFTALQPRRDHAATHRGELVALASKTRIDSQARASKE